MTRAEICGQVWEITRHAVDRALEMGIAGEDIRACLESPDEVVASVKYPGTWHYKRDDFTLCVAFDRDIPTVVTCVWGSNEAWRRDLLERPYNGDREYRPAQRLGRGTR